VAYRMTSTSMTLYDLELLSLLLL